MGEHDTHMERIRAVMRGQLAPEAEGSGHRLILMCPDCKRAWYQDGPRAFPRLEPEKLAELAQEFQADLSNLPYATCPLCGATKGLGEITLDQYGTGQGYGVSIELAEPVGGHLLAVAIQLDWLQRQRNLRSGVVTDFTECRAFLHWLEQVRVPLAYHRLDARDSTAIAARNRPGHGAPGTEDWIWCGASWEEKFRGLKGGKYYICLQQANPPDEPFSLAFMFETWNHFAALISAGRITGEHAE